MSVKAEGKMLVLLGHLSDGLIAVGPFEEDEEGYRFVDKQCEADEYSFLTVYSPEDFVPDKWGDLILERTEDATT